MTFESIPEAAREMGFSERGVRKVYHAKRNRIGEYELEWLEPVPIPPPEPVPKSKFEKIKESKVILKCFICSEPLTAKDRMDDRSFSIEDLNSGGDPISTSYPDSLYGASKMYGISLGALRNARDKGNTLITRRKDKRQFRVWWGASHESCFEARRMRMREQEREEIERRDRERKAKEKKEGSITGTGTETGLQSHSEPWFRN